MSMFTHVVIGTNDLPKAQAFYDGVLATLGAKRMMDMGDKASLWGAGAPQFMVTLPANGQPASYANGGTIGLAASTRDAVHAFHEKALELGGSCEGAPGPRQFSPTAYAAYIRDPDGNKLCAYCFAPG